MKTTHIAETSTVVITPVEKEDVNYLHFPSEEVLLTLVATQQRRNELERAVMLGNTYSGKTKIVFEDSEGFKQIETHVWGLTDRRVILKQGFVIPINRIHEVIL